MQDLRTKHYTMKEFKALKRNGDGELINMFEHFLLLTDKQVDLLSNDDWQRYHDCQCELAYEMQSLAKEMQAQEGLTMSYQYVYNNHSEFWVSYRGTSNGAYIRASSAQAAKWIFAEGEGLSSIVYLKASKRRA